jgi:RNA binding exosome subunit
MGELIQTYWAEILLALMAFVKVIVNLTPTEADNKVFGWLDTLISAIVSDRRKERREARKND